MTEPAPWQVPVGLPVLVTGARTSGVAVARLLRERGAVVTVAEADEGQAQSLRAEGFPVSNLALPPAGTALVVTSPGFRPDHPLLLAAAAAGYEVIGDVELAWRLRPVGGPRWLALTGTNGKTTAVRMLAEILRAAGRRAVAAGNVGVPALDAVLATDGDGLPAYDVLAVELSSFQLHWSSTLVPRAAAVLNIAPDHLDWHGTFDDYARAKARIWAGEIAIGNADDEVTRTLLRRAPGRHVTTTLGVPRAGELGVVDGRLVDRAFSDMPAPDIGDIVGMADSAGTPLAGLADIAGGAPHDVANALAAAALARADGVSADAVARGLRAFVHDPHRNQRVASAGGVDWVDDSKATNPHAAAASLSAYPSVVWVAGGLGKGLDVEDLVRGAVARLRGAVLLGTSRPQLRAALARHAPQIPVVEVERTDTGSMDCVVIEAARLARAGDTVLLAPAAASMDMFHDYGARGDAFATAVRKHLAVGA